ncbi:MAG: hypothetical protein IJN16_01060 [Lachnospiraceae bacterium]|nr:hypothetical protein [Lachnospiraceae bacterium]
MEDVRENCPGRVLRAVSFKNFGKPSLSGSNTARKPTLQVNEWSAIRQATRVEPRKLRPL